VHQPDYNIISNYLRFIILTATYAVGSGHPTSNFSAIDLMSVLYAKYFRFAMDDFSNPLNDRLIVSKGHASALLYALGVLSGQISEDDFYTYRKFQSPLEGHPTFRYKYAQAATGSLGQGLSIGAGMAWAIAKNKAYHTKPKVYVLLGDGEMAEGSVWEAISWAAHRRLSNLVGIIDVNKFGQSGETAVGWNTEVYRRRFESFGWEVIVIDGHNFEEIEIAYDKALTGQDKPVAIVAKTIKGKGINYWEDKNGWHNKMLPPEEYEKALAVLRTDKPAVIISKPDTNDTSDPSSLSSLSNQRDIEIRDYDPGDKYPAKLAFGKALVNAGKITDRLLVLDADVSNSLHTDLFKEKYPDRFLQMFIAEQNMAGVAVGLAGSGYIPVINTFAAFLTRCHDQLRMAPLSDVTMIVNGSYVGVSLGLDGPSQMGLEDLAMMRSIYGSTVLYPSDPYQTEILFYDVLDQIGKGNLKGVIYFRTTREPAPVIYTPKHKFTVGGSYIFPSSCFNHNNQQITIISAGITLHEALIAQKELESQNIPVQVLDCYSVKPLDIQAITEAAMSSRAFVVVEDHYPEGGLGEAVISCLTETNSTIPVKHMAVNKLPMSGKAGELLNWTGIDSGNIIKVIKEMQL